MTPPNSFDRSSADDLNEWVECPRCRAVMLPLRDYEIQAASEFPTVEAEPWEFFLWGWWALVFNFVVGLLGFGGQKARLARLKRTILPRFPRSLVCPRCFFVRQRL